LSGSQSHRGQVADGVGQRVDLGGQPAPGAAQRVIVRLVGQILVIRVRPLCGRWLRPCPGPGSSARPRRAGGRARPWNRSTATGRGRRWRRCRSGIAPHRTSAGRCRRWRTGGGASTPSAMARRPQAGLAMPSRCESARRSLPGSGGDRPVACRVSLPGTASAARPTPTTRLGSRENESLADHRLLPGKIFGDTP